MKWLVLLLLILPVFTGCAGKDPVVAFYEYADFQDNWDCLAEDGEEVTGYDAEDIERWMQHQPVFCDEDGIYYHVDLAGVSKRATTLNRPATLKAQDHASFALSIVCLERATVYYQVTNLTSKPLNMPQYYVLDVQIGGNWYSVAAWSDADEENVHMGGRMKPLEPGEKREHFKYSGGQRFMLPAGHYRVGLTHDYETGWVAVEFDADENGVVS